MLDPIPGDPEKLAAAAGVFAAGGAAVEALVGRAGWASDSELANWKGPAARSFRTNWSATQDGLRRAEEACREIASALNQLSVQLADAQATLRRAQSMLAAGGETDAIRLGAQAEEQARQAFTAASGAFARVEAAARTLRAGMAASKPAASVLVTPAEPGLAWLEGFPIVSLGPSIQVTLIPSEAPWREFFPIAPPTNQPLTSSSAPDPRDILMPGGRPIGQPGTSANVRKLPGGLPVAQALFLRLAQGGMPNTPSNYRGRGVDLPGGGWIGLRPNTKSSNSPAIDVSIAGVNFRKIHF